VAPFALVFPPSPLSNEVVDTEQDRKIGTWHQHIRRCPYPTTIWSQVMHTKKAAKNRIQATAHHRNRPFGTRLLNFAAATLPQHFGQRRQIKPRWGNSPK